MAATLEQLKREVAQRQDECDQLKDAHNRAAETFESRNNTLTLIAVVSSSLTGGSAIWSALEGTVSEPLPLALWATALASVITTIITSAQKTPLGSAEEARNHHKAAMGYAELARAARRLAESDYDEAKLRSALADVDAGINQTNNIAPILSEKFKAKPEPAAIQLNKLHAAGLVDVFSTRASGEAADLLGKRFQENPKKVQILETWTGLGPQGLGRWVDEAVKDGAQVEILLLDPTSEHVEYRGEALARTGVSAADVKNNIEEDLKILGQVLGELDQNSGYEGTLEIRTYDVTPVVNMYRFDEVRIVGMYLWAEDSITGPQFEVKEEDGDESTFLVADFDAHFKNIWDLQGEHPTKKVRVEKVESETKTVKVVGSEVIVDI